MPKELFAVLFNDRFFITDMETVFHMIQAVFLRASLVILSTFKEYHMSTYHLREGGSFLDMLTFLEILNLPLTLFLRSAGERQD